MDAFYSEFGCLTVKKSELVEAIKNTDGFNPQHCHDYAGAHFSSVRMAEAYLKLYAEVLNGHAIHEIAPAVNEVIEDKFLPFGD
jgi:hypothetical protein